MVQQNEIIHIAQVVPTFELVFNELIQIVEIDIGEELAGQVANGQALFGGRVGQPLVWRYSCEILRAALADGGIRRVAGKQPAGEPEKFFSPPPNLNAVDLIHTS